MASFDLVCKGCGHAFTVGSRNAIREKQKRCPQCRSKLVRQTLTSYLRNGPLSSPTCGATPTGGFG
jgi:putative FmdB family regulatory protein